MKKGNLKPKSEHKCIMRNDLEGNARIVENPPLYHTVRKQKKTGL